MTQCVATTTQKKYFKADVRRERGTLPATEKKKKFASHRGSVFGGISGDGMLYAKVCRRCRTTKTCFVFFCAVMVTVSMPSYTHILSEIHWQKKRDFFLN